MAKTSPEAQRHSPPQRALTGEVRLRDVLESDLPILFEHQLDPVATQMAAFPARDQKAFTAHWAKIMPDHTNILQAILFNEQVAGYLVSWNREGRRQVGYWLGREFWGKGIATRALAEFLDQVKARPLYAHVVKHNIASRRVLEKCGFALSGVDRALSESGGEPIEEFILRLD